MPADALTVPRRNSDPLVAVTVTVGATGPVAAVANPIPGGPPAARVMRHDPVGQV